MFTANLEMRLVTLKRKVKLFRLTVLLPKTELINSCFLRSMHLFAITTVLCSINFFLFVNKCVCILVCI